MVSFKSTNTITHLSTWEKYFSASFYFTAQTTCEHKNDLFHVKHLQLAVAMALGWFMASDSRKCLSFSVSCSMWNTLRTSVRMCIKSTYSFVVNCWLFRLMVRRITWWVLARGGEEPWRAERSRVYASCSAVHWTWDTDGSGIKQITSETQSLRYHCVFACVCVRYLLQCASPSVE